MCGLLSVVQQANLAVDTDVLAARWRVPLVHRSLLR